MATSKALRAAPDRKLSDYVASIKRLFGDPVTASDDKFIKQNYIITFNSTVTVGGLSPWQGYSSVLPIGFDFKVNGVTYKEFIVQASGWMMLKDPAGGTSGANFWHDVLDSTDLSAVNYNNSIIKSTFSYNHILLAPFFSQSRLICESIDELQTVSGGYSAVITSTIEDQIQNGSNTNLWPYSTKDHGVRYVNSFDPRRGKCLIVRWSLTSIGYDRRKLEVVLFENGTIEYRYWPTVTFSPGGGASDQTDGTIGIFWSSATFGANNFRDLSPLLDYKKDQRTISHLGGVQGPDLFTEESQLWNPGAKVYAVNVNSTQYWPRNGAVITLSPPVTSGKFLPKKIIGDIASTRPVVRSPNAYDDRKTIPYSSNTLIYAPSSLPSRLIGDSGDIDVSLRQMLFVSGNMSMQGSVNKSSVNDLLGQLDAIEKLAERSDNSFNEFQKNYSMFSSTDRFYTTGSAIEEFGTGFEEQLKSKTQIYISLPVTKQTRMPSLTASFYYYHSELQQWITPFPESDSGNALSIISEKDDALSSYEYQLTGTPTYRVVESARGFDAVGRKIVSGSDTTIQSFPAIPPSSGDTMQSDRAIGGVANNLGVRAENLGTNIDSTFGFYADEAHQRKYSKSIYDDPSIQPSDFQKINLNIENPFLIEKVEVKFPLYINGDWFKDVTTCMRPFTDSTDTWTLADGRGSRYNYSGRFRGAIDFGGPGITFGLFCHRKNAATNFSTMDLIASGTITHTKDNSIDVVLKKDPNMTYYSMRPVGFRSFSNPTTVISGTNNVYDDNVSLRMVASVAGGITYASLERSWITSSYLTPSTVDTGLVQNNRDRATQLLTTQKIFPLGTGSINSFDMRKGIFEPEYPNRSPRIFVQQVSPLSRGKTGVEFNGNSILGGTITSFNRAGLIKNPLYVSASQSLLPTYFTDIINLSNFGFEGVSVYSTVKSSPSPYLMQPGDKLTLSISKVRPIIYRARDVNKSSALMNVFSTFDLTGSHDIVMLNTGSIELRIYGSYVRGGVSFNP